MQELLGRVLKVWEKRLPLTPAQLQALGEEAYARGWGLAGIWEQKFLERIQGSLTTAIAKGSTYSEWTQNEGQKILDAFGAGVSTYKGGKRWDPWYSELVMRNATQASFAGGRYSAMFAPEWQQIAPFVRYYATLDDRTRPAHAALHGRVFRKDDAAARNYYPPLGHGCFPAETPILGSIRRGFSYRYSGDVVRIQTRAGNRLTLTIDHPVLTPRGWVAAKLLREGDGVLGHVGGAEGGLDPLRTDEAVRRILGPRETRLATPRLNVHGRPSFAGELFRALPEAFAELVSDRRSQDLYGKPLIEERHVEVERQHRELLLDAKPAAAELLRYLRLALVHVDHSFVAGLRRANAHGQWGLAAALGLPGAGELAFDGGRVGLQLGPLGALGLALSTKGHARLAELASESGSRAPGFIRERLHRIAGLVAGREGGKPGDHSAGGGALAEDTLTSVRHGSFDGDVFDFETAHGWMVASGIVISNCRCQLVELTLAEVEDAGYPITDGNRIPLLPTADGGMVGRPPGGWDIDRVTANASRVLSQVTKVPSVPAPQPTPVAPPPVAPTASPAGKPSGTAVSGRTRGLPHPTLQVADRKAVDHVLGVIDSVHGDGTLPKAEILGQLGDAGYYTQVGEEIRFGRTAPHKHVQIAHEVGHWLDVRGIPKGALPYASEGKTMADVMDAIGKSKSVAALKAKGLHPDDLAYLMKPTELWARAYSQYVSEVSGDTAMLKQVKLWRDGLAAHREPDAMWDTVDFKPIRDQIEKVMRSLGWRT